MYYYWQTQFYTNSHCGINLVMFRCSAGGSILLVTEGLL